MSDTAQTELSMLAGSMVHMARYLHTGCPRAEVLSDLLLDRASEARALPEDVLLACRQLQAAIWQQR